MTATTWPPRQEDPPALPRPEDWTLLALCAEVGDDFWFPEKGGSTREAKRVCRSCLVRADCLEYALDNDERFGIWGGMSERERRKVKRQAVA
jgi:WhiB family redox-sensing transcriptional regulator